MRLRPGHGLTASGEQLPKHGWNLAKGAGEIPAAQVRWMKRVDDVRGYNRPDCGGSVMKQEEAEESALGEEGRSGRDQVEFKTKEKGKPLSTADRLDRIERLLGISK